MNLLDLFVRITAKDEASSTIDDVSNNIVGKLASAAKTAAKALAGMWAVKKAVDFGKAAFGAYSEFEQLAGGAKKIFDEIDQSKILNDANDAWKTLNMSANEYLAAINQTGATFAQTMGDEAGYETAKKGMQAISDYATGTGKDIGLLTEKFGMITRSTSSYQSIADQFSGILPQTNKDFLEQAQAAGLLSDKYKKLTEVPVAEYQQAVSGMLEKGVADLGLAGNTAKEALTTISGSVLATKSAWQNLITEIGKPDANLGARVSDMMTALFGEVDKQTGERAGGLVNNVRAEVETIAANVVSAVPKLVTGIMGSLPDEVSSRLQGVIDVVSGIWEKLTSVINVDAIVEKVGIVADGIGSFFDSLGSTIDFGYINVAIDTVSSIVQQAWGFVEQNVIPHLPELGTIVGNVANFVMSLATSVLNVVNALAPFLPAVLGAVAAVKGFTIIQTIIGFVSSLGGVIATAGAFISTFGGVLGTVAAVFGGWPIIIAGVIGAIVGFIATNEDARAKIKEVWDNLCELVGNAVTSIGEFMGNLGESIGDAMETVTGLIDDAIQKVVGFFDGVGKFISDPVGTIKNGLDSMGASFGGAADSAESGMERVEKSVDGGKKSIQKYNGTKLKDKKAKAEIKGNAADGKGKKAVSETDKAMRSMSDKRVSAEIKGNAMNTAVKDALNKTSSAISGIKSKNASVNISGNALSDSVIEKIKAARDAIRTLASKTVNVAISGLKGILSSGGAWGGITPTYHAAGGVRVASRWGEGVPLDVVGERGPEAIVPLTSRYGSDFARMMGQEASKYLGGPTYILQIGDIQYNTDKAMDEAIDHWFSVAARKAGQYGIA